MYVITHLYYLPLLVRLRPQVRAAVAGQKGREAGQAGQAWGAERQPAAASQRGGHLFKTYLFLNVGIALAVLHYLP